MLAGNVVSAAIRQAQLRREIDITRQLLALEQRDLRLLKRAIVPVDFRSRCGEPENNGRPIAGYDSSARSAARCGGPQLAVLMGRLPPRLRFRGSRWTRCSFRRSCVEPSSALSAAARHSGGRIADASGERQRRRGDRQSLSANCAVGSGGHWTSFISGGDVWNVASSLTQPIYNGGALRAEKRKAEQLTRKRTASTGKLCSRRSDKWPTRSLPLTRRADAQSAQRCRSRCGYELSDCSGTLSGGRDQRVDSAGGRAAAASDRTRPHERCRGGYADSATLFQALGGAGGTTESASSVAPSGDSSRDCASFRPSSISASHATSSPRAVRLRDEAQVAGGGFPARKLRAQPPRPRHNNPALR